MNKSKKITKLYNSCFQSSLKRGHPRPAYTPAELREYLLQSEEFNRVYDVWEITGFQKELAPSIDRIDWRKPYTFDNIQIITLQENIDKGRTERNYKKVEVYDITGVFITEFRSMDEAAEKLNLTKSSIIKNISGVTGLTGNKYQFKFKGSDKVMRDVSGVADNYIKKPILKLSKSGEILERFSSLSAIAKAMGKPRRKVEDIKQVCIGQRRSAFGFDWRYEADDLNKNVEILKEEKKRLKIVEQYDLQGNFIQEFPTAVEAERQLNILGVASSCKRLDSHVGGFQWRYKHGNKSIGVYPHINTTKKVVELSLSGQYITTHESASAAANTILGKLWGLRKCLYGEKNSYYGRKWVYEKEYDPDKYPIEEQVICCKPQLFTGLIPKK